MLTSISLADGCSSGLSSPLRGVPGVRGRLGVLGLVGVLGRVGVPGTGARADFVFAKPRVRDSAETGALYFLWVDARRLGVPVVRARRAVRESEEDVDVEESEERGRLGVKGAGRGCFEPAGVLGTVIVDVVVQPQSVSVAESVQ